MSTSEASLSSRLEPPQGERSVALCLSGGGYRAMLFHLGALWRLNELGWLPRLDRVSSVSGGSIAAGVLAKHWNDLQFDAHGVGQRFVDTVAADLHALAGRTLDARSVLGGLLRRGTIGDRVADAYRRHLFGTRTLQDLPDAPRFIFNAANLQSGALWRFSKPYMADWRVGWVLNPRVELAIAVAASSAFPPFLSPVRLQLAPGAVEPFPDEPLPELHCPPFTTDVVLSDGGVYDNLGLQPAEHSRVKLVSDGGARIRFVERPRRAWPLQLLRVMRVMDNQVRSLRKSELISDYREPDGRLEGAYWGIRSAIVRYHPRDRRPTLPALPDRTCELAKIKTRLARLSTAQQQRLVNWGYAIADAGMRAHVLDGASPSPAPTFPYPEVGV